MLIPTPTPLSHPTPFYLFWRLKSERVIGSGADEWDAFESEQLPILRVAENQKPTFVFGLGELRSHGLMKTKRIKVEIVT